MKCVNHIDKDAVVVCNHCGKSLCSDCFMEVNRESYCKDCLAQKGGLAKKEERSTSLAAVLSCAIAGLGQFYNGQPGKGLLFFFTGWLIIPWIIGIFDAYKTAKRINAGEITVKAKPGCLIAFVVGVICSLFAIFFIGLLSAIAIPNFLVARLRANEARAEVVLKTISAAIENYRVINSAYPKEETDLTIATPPYLSQPYSNRTTAGYSFSEELRADGYKVVAIPAECGITGNKIFTAKTGGLITEEKCAKKEDE